MRPSAASFGPHAEENSVEVIQPQIKPSRTEFLQMEPERKRKSMISIPASIRKQSILAATLLGLALPLHAESAANREAYLDSALPV